MKKTTKFLLILTTVAMLMSIGITASAAIVIDNHKESGANHNSLYQQIDFVNNVNTISAINKNTYSSLVSKLNSQANAARQRIEQLYDIDKSAIESYISEANEALSRMNQILGEIGSASGSTYTALTSEFNSLEARVEYLCDLILTSSAESRVVSARSAWHRPEEKNYTEMKNSVKTFKNSGINLIFLETFFHGCAAFKTDLPDIPYHPTLSYNYTDPETGEVFSDYLTAFLHLCGEYGIEVHAWVENFYVGISMSAQIIRNHPDWIMYNDDGSILQRKEGGEYIFIDPANKEVQDLLIDFYNEIFEKHPEVAGLNLDYIRYPVSNRSMDTGYTVAAMEGFYQLLGKEFTEAQKSDRAKMANKFKQLFNEDYLPGGSSEANANYQGWVEYRTEIITEFVRRIKNEVKLPKDIILSTAVFASLTESLDSKKADWQGWFANGWIDIATPMAYYTSASTVETRVKEMIRVGGSDCLYYTGIASSYSGLPAWQNKEFLEASYNAGAVGYVIFSAAQILGHDDVQLALSSGVNSKWAILPHAEISEILSATFTDALDKADRIYIPAGGMTEKELCNLQAVFEDISSMQTKTVYGVYSVLLRITELIGSLDEYANGYSYQRIKDQLTVLSGILDTRISIQMVREGKWNPENEAQRPEIKDDEPVIPEEPHLCESICLECAKCLDTECTEAVCSKKCLGHELVSPPDDPILPDDPDEPDEPDEPDTPDIPDTPDEPNAPDTPGEETKYEGQGDQNEEPRVGFFQRIWRAIRDFFRRLFGIKK